MGVGDKIQNAGEEAAGKVKETTGRATGNQSLEAEGRADQASANVKQAGEKAKDARDIEQGERLRRSRGNTATTSEND